MRKKAICPDCGLEEEYVPDCFGLSYYQAVGECIRCGAPTVDEEGELTTETYLISLKTEGI